MGLFGFFTKKKEIPQTILEPKENPARKPSLPTMKVDPALHVAYEVAFRDVMKNVDGFTADEINQMLEFISACSAGHLGSHEYHKPIFEKFFSGRDWSWSEYEHWEKVFRDLGRYPVTWNKKKPTLVSFSSIFYSYKVSDLKSFLDTHGVAYPEKAKKKDMLEIIANMPNIEKTQPWLDKVAKREQDMEDEKGIGLHTILMRHISFRAKNIFDLERRKGLGISKSKKVYVHEGDDEFVKMALKRNPNALPPYFPLDHTILQAVIPGFED